MYDNHVYCHKFFILLFHIIMYKGVVNSPYMIRDTVLYTYIECD